jgi:glucosamine--fructose-6-phosphate aminotransferase (isomerizing)
MDPDLFLADLERKPETLEALALSIGRADPWAAFQIPDRLLFLGMGSSLYAAAVMARRLRAIGRNAVAESAATAASWPPGAGTAVVAVSATGSSVETLTSVAAYTGRSPLVALTNQAQSPLGVVADLVIPMAAGVETGGVACRTFQHTLLLLLALEAHLGAGDMVAVGELGRRAAAATADLLARRGVWLPDLLGLLDGPHGVYALAPSERLSSSLQSALMLREGPRRAATGCETGDWSHVDVYLTKTLDYRALLFPGSRWDAQAMEWTTQRGSTTVGIGDRVEGATYTLRYVHDDDLLVRLLVETTVAELIAASWWQPSQG